MTTATAAGTERWPIATTTGRVLLAAPRFDDAASLEAMLERVEPGFELTGATYDGNGEGDVFDATN